MEKMCGVLRNFLVQRSICGNPQSFVSDEPSDCCVTSLPLDVTRYVKRMSQISVCVYSPFDEEIVTTVQRVVRTRFTTFS
jgi:hypothetical protein